MPSIDLKSPTMGIDPPMAIITAGLFHSSVSAPCAVVRKGES